MLFDFLLQKLFGRTFEAIAIGILTRKISSTKLAFVCNQGPNTYIILFFTFLDKIK